jgi:ribokinase
VRAAVVGHVEWIEFARVERVPEPGQIVHATDVWEEPGGGGAVAAVQLSKLAGGAAFYTALGDDEVGHRAHSALENLGLEVHVAWRDEPQRRAFVHVDGRSERTITVMGDRLGPSADDDLPWHRLSGVDAIYLSAGDPGAVRAARAARTLVSTVRGIDTLREAGVRLDALVASANDRGERFQRGDIEPPPDAVLRTDGPNGGAWARPDGQSGSWEAARLPAPPVDAYGCGDSFAAGLTYALGAGRSLDEAAATGAKCGAACMTGRGPYAGQLTAKDL